jgi:hypothetical protein
MGSYLGSFLLSLLLPCLTIAAQIIVIISLSVTVRFLSVIQFAISTRVNLYHLRLDRHVRLLPSHLMWNLIELV